MFELRFLSTSQVSNFHSRRKNISGQMVCQKSCVHMHVSSVVVCMEASQSHLMFPSLTIFPFPLRCVLLLCA